MPVVSESREQCSQSSPNTVGIYSPGNALVVYDMRRQVCTEGISRLWTYLCWYIVIHLAYSAIAGHDALYSNPLSVSEPQAVMIHRKYLQGLSTWRRGHFVQSSGALSEGASRDQIRIAHTSNLLEVTNASPRRKSTVDLVAKIW